MTEYPKKRILAFDVGDKRIGVAVSDALGITAQGVETYTRQNRQRDIEHILELAQRYSPCVLLFGLPLNMDGSSGPQAEKVKLFAARILEHWEGEHLFYDERMTTMAASRFLLDGDVSRGKRKQVIDKLAAVVILQDYMASLHR